MINLIRLSVLMLMTLFCVKNYAQSMTLKLAPKESKTIENHYLWTLHATCTITANKSAKKIRIHVIKLNGIVNGRSLKTGQSTSVTVHNQDSLSVSADAGAEVNLQNLSHDAIQASCSA